MFDPNQFGKNPGVLTPELLSREAKKLGLASKKMRALSDNFRVVAKGKDSTPTAIVAVGVESIDVVFYDITPRELLSSLVVGRFVRPSDESLYYGEDHLNRIDHLRGLLQTMSM